MILYISLFLLTTIFYFISVNKQKQSRIIISILMIILALIVGCSDMLGGYDRYIYGALFDGLADSMREDKSLVETSIFNFYFKEQGYCWFNVLVAMFTKNRYVFILIITLTSYILILYSFNKYTNRSPLVVLLFLGMWFFFTFSYIRQVFSVSIAWLAIRYIIDRKPIPFLFFSLIAVTVHNAALIFSLLYFIPSRKIGLSKVLIIMAFCFIVGLLNIAGSLFEQVGLITDSEQRFEIYQRETELSQLRIEYLIEAVVFLTFILCRYSYLDISNKTQLVMTNISLAFCAVLLLFIRSGNGGRLGWYFMIGIFSIIPYLSHKNGKFEPYGILVILLSAFLYLRLLLSWGILLYPYKSFFSDGVREGDDMTEVYEYDFNYHKDKFYR